MIRRKPYCKPKKFLCAYHNDIMYNLDCIKTFVKKLELTESEKRYILDLCKSTKKYTKECKKMGQKMENRLSKYRRAVESLGFKRV